MAKTAPPKTTPRNGNNGKNGKKAARVTELPKITNATDTRDILAHAAKERDPTTTSSSISTPT